MMEREQKIRAVLINVGEAPKIVEIENELEAFQKIVGGYIECVSIGFDMIMVINEEGKLLELPPNIDLGYDVIAGNAVIVGVDQTNGEFTSLSRLQMMLLETGAIPMFLIR
jgi:Domain of unknown function (DUF3846)